MFLASDLEKMEVKIKKSINELKALDEEAYAYFSKKFESSQRTLVLTAACMYAIGFGAFFYLLIFENVPWYLLLAFLFLDILLFIYFTYCLSNEYGDDLNNIYKDINAARKYKYMINDFYDVNRISAEYEKESRKITDYYLKKAKILRGRFLIKTIIAGAFPIGIGISTLYRYMNDIPSNDIITLIQIFVCVGSIIIINDLSKANRKALDDIFKEHEKELQIVYEKYRQRLENMVYGKSCNS